MGVYEAVSKDTCEPKTVGDLKIISSAEAYITHVMYASADDINIACPSWSGALSVVLYM